MQRLQIKKFGPIEECDIEVKDYLVLTGTQASGKSTVAKCIFFFNNIKVLLLQLIKREYLQAAGNDEEHIALAQKLKIEIRGCFLQIFGSTMAMDPGLSIIYTYDDGESIALSLEDRSDQYHFAKFRISEGMWQKLIELEAGLNKGRFCSADECRRVIESEIFHNSREIIYIPAGRSMMTLLSSQINYLYSTMDDTQKRSLDYCTQNYLERILQLKPLFSDNLEQMINDRKYTTYKKMELHVLEKMTKLYKRILKGEYRSVGSEERLQISADHYVKINYASSGQQEVLWILNVLFYYMLNNKSALYIIEEPESHLFPDAQMLITQFISLAKNHDSRIVLTTHSPYILGSINNLLYANRISGLVDRSELNDLLDESCWMPFEKMGAYYLENGELHDCADPEYENIQNDVIDSASEDINTLFEQMVELKEK